MLSVNNLSAGYGKNTIIHDISFSLSQNYVVSIIGKNGSGKSTLLKAITNLIDISDGNVLVDDADIKTLKRNDLAKKISYLAQIRNIPDMTVEQLVLHGRFPYLSYYGKYSKSDIEVAHNMISKMGISDLMNRPLKSLSGGQVQKAYIAFSLTQNTDYILFDEPTTFLDTSYQISLMKSLNDLAKEGKGVLAVMHDLPLAFNFSDFIMVIDNGRLVAFDTPENIIKNDIVFELFGVKINKNDNGIYYTLLEK
jgi:iron complex transport system ATP-binding protein